MKCTVILGVFLLIVGSCLAAPLESSSSDIKTDKLEGAEESGSMPTNTTLKPGTGMKREAEDSNEGAPGAPSDSPEGAPGAPAARSSDDILILEDDEVINPGEYGFPSEDEIVIRIKELDLFDDDDSDHESARRDAEAEPEPKKDKSGKNPAELELEENKKPENSTHPKVDDNKNATLCANDTVMPFNSTATHLKLDDNKNATLCGNATVIPSNSTCNSSSHDHDHDDDNDHHHFNSTIPCNNATVHLDESGKNITMAKNETEQANPSNSTTSPPTTTTTTEAPSRYRRDLAAEAEGGFEASFGGGASSSHGYGHYSRGQSSRSFEAASEGSASFEIGGGGIVGHHHHHSHQTYKPKPTYSAAVVREEEEPALKMVTLNYVPVKSKSKSSAPQLTRTIEGEAQGAFEASFEAGSSGSIGVPPHHHHHQHHHHHEQQYQSYKPKPNYSSSAKMSPSSRTFESEAEGAFEGSFEASSGGSIGAPPHHHHHHHEQQYQSYKPKPNYSATSRSAPAVPEARTFGYSASVKMAPSSRTIESEAEGAFEASFEAGSSGAIGTQPVHHHHHHHDNDHYQSSYKPKPTYGGSYSKKSSSASKSMSRTFEAEAEAAFEASAGGAIGPIHHHHHHHHHHQSEESYYKPGTGSSSYGSSSKKSMTRDFEAEAEGAFEASFGGGSSGSTHHHHHQSYKPKPSYGSAAATRDFEAEAEGAFEAGSGGSASSGGYQKPSYTTVVREEVTAAPEAKTVSYSGSGPYVHAVRVLY